MFFELYGTWEMYLCPDPDCLRLFQDDESLITHIKCEHFPHIQPVAWPPRLQNLSEELWCADALRKMVWRPFVVEAALDMFSSMCLDYQYVTLADVCAGCDQLNSLNWVYSEDPERKLLLVELEKEFQVLLTEHQPASFSLLSDRYFTKMTALASKHIFVDRPPRCNTQFLQGLLACSPLSFCFLEAADLSRFIKLVKKMSQFVKQARLPYANQELDSVEGDVSWNKSDILDVLSFSPKESCFSFYEASSRDGVSILSILCNGPCMPSIPKVPSKAFESFSSLQKVLDELGVPVIVDCIEFDFQSERNHLQLVNRVQYLESQLRQLCALDCRMYILPLMISFFRMKLYYSFRCHQRKVRAENPATQCPTIPNHEEHIEQNVSREEKESIYDSDSESDSDEDSDFDEKPWREIPALCHLDSTLRESVTGKTEESGPFFWIEISDVLRHCEKKHSGAGCESVREGIRCFRLNKTWKYWLCYSCDRTFIDPESYMVHLENKHHLCIAHDDYWLIPQQESRNQCEEFRQEVGKKELDLEESITIDHSYDYFLVDSTKFYEMPSTNKEDEHGQEKCKQNLEIVHNLQNQISYLTRLFQIKRKKLTYLEVVNALGLRLFNGGQPLSLLVSWLHKLSSVDWRIGTTHQLQFKFLSQLLNKAHNQGYGPLNNYSVLEVFKDMKHDLIYELSLTDQKIVRAVDKIDDMKCYLSNLCEYDYRTKIVPSVRSFLHAKFKFHDSLRSLECNNVKELLSTLDEWLDEGSAYSFKAVVLSPGKVIINARENKPSRSWTFAYIGIHLSFVGLWSFTGKVVTGGIKFGGWSNLDEKIYTQTGRMTSDSHEVMESTEWPLLGDDMFKVLSRMLFCLVYKEQIRSDEGEVETSD